MLSQSQNPRSDLYKAAATIAHDAWSEGQLFVEETIRKGVHRIQDLPAEIAEAIQGSKMNPAHDHLNVLLDEK